jgi:hemerythrin-like domain-containing protein
MVEHDKGDGLRRSSLYGFAGMTRMSSGASAYHADVPAAPEESLAKRTAARKQSTRRASPVKRATAKKAPSKRVTSSTARRKTAARAAATRARTKTPVAKRSRLAAATALVRGAAASAVVAVAARWPWAKDENDPIVLLETDHRRFEDLLKRGEETTTRAVKGRTQLLKTLTAELNVHELLEEQVLYPALEPHGQARDIVLEGYQEHHVADVLLKELHELAKDNAQWGAKFKVLKESIEHHIEEEERIMFRMARGVLDRDALRELGARMKALRADIDEAP